MKLYEAIGRAEGCRALATAFYTHVAQDPVLRPLFPSTFKCAIEEFSAFLVQFLGGDSAQAQSRWWLSLRESHRRFVIGQREREAWLRAMAATLGSGSVIADARVRADLMAFFTHSSAHLVNSGPLPDSPAPLTGELARLWAEQSALEDAVAHKCPLDNELLKARFARSPSVHASFLSLAAASKVPSTRAYALDQIRANPSLVHEHTRRWRTLLHEAAGRGDLELVEMLLALGGIVEGDARARSLLYCVGNECSSPDGGKIVRLLLRRTPVRVNAIHGPKRCTALHMAARRGNVDVIAALLECGADIEARDSVGDTPLRRAVNCNKVDAAKLLLASGADAHSIGSKGLTPAQAVRSPQMKHLFAAVTDVVGQYARARQMGPPHR